MTDNDVRVSPTGLNSVDLRPQVTAGALVAPPPGVADDTPLDQQQEQRLIDWGQEDTEGPAGEDTTRAELDANDAGGPSCDPGDPAADVAGTIASRPG